jgi:GNAT superfamily N-acetyltransferase
MKIELQKATINDVKKIYDMQVASFKTLLDKYQDYETNPGAESLEKISSRLNQSWTHFYIIIYENEMVGAVRIVLKENGKKCRISPLFILPEYQNKGLAQEVFKIIEDKYRPQNGWELDTILEEKGNCHLYEKMGYKRTGEYKKINDRMTLVYYEKKA